MRVTTSGGALRGTPTRRAGCSGVHAFYGVPFAAAPVGAGRFASPVPPAPWSGVRDASALGVVVPQNPVPAPLDRVFRPRGAQGGDCLNLNVWTPDAGSSLPVLVWIHGGGFQVGSGNEDLYDGSRFARDGVVCVTINYRLGAEGFLHVGDDTPGSGNYGTLDQIAALRWVSDNIAAFGGDPARVTIAGESSGAMSVAALLAAPGARGLFRGAILQSGAGHNGLAGSAAAHVAAEVRRRLGVGQGLDALRAVPVDRVLQVQGEVAAEVATSSDRERWGPVIDRPWTIPFQPVVGGDVVPDLPIDAVRRGRVADIPLLVGYCAEEYRLHLGAASEFFTVDEDVVAALYGAVFGDHASAARALYAETAGADPTSLVAAIQTDRQYRVPAIRLAAAQAAVGGRAWLYRHARRSSAFGGTIGAGHATELPYVFDLLDDDTSALLAGVDAPQQLADVMHAAWVRFVSDGDPSGPSLTWPMVDATCPTMVFDDSSGVAYAPDAATLRWYDDLPERLLGV